FLRLGLGQPDAGDLRVAISAPRDRGAVERVGVDFLVAQFPRDRFGRGHPFVARLVREPGPRRAIADRPQPLGCRPAIGIDLDDPAVELHAEVLEPELFGIGYDADGDDHVAVVAAFDFAVLALDPDRDTAAAHFQILERGAGADRHALLGE